MKTTPGQLVRQTRREVAKVVWPTRKEAMVSTAMVAAMAVVAAVFFFFVDQIMAWGMRLVFGLGR